MGSQRFTEINVPGETLGGKGGGKREKRGTRRGDADALKYLFRGIVHFYLAMCKKVLRASY